MSVRSLFTYNSTESDLLSLTEYFVIDSKSRTITPPVDFNGFGVEADKNSNRVWFECPKIVGDNIDLTTLNLYVNFKNAKGEKDRYLVKDVTVDGDIIHFSWLLKPKVMKYSGIVSFIVCAVSTDTAGVINVEWNTTLATGTVLGGLEVEATEIPEETNDLVNQLVDIVKQSISDMAAASTGAIADVQTAETEAIQNIETAKVEAIKNVENTSNSLFSNSIKGAARGAVVKTDDVSPVLHNIPVTVSSKNLCSFSGSGEKNGLTYSFNNESWTVQGTPTIKYAGIVSQDITKILEDGETYTISQSKYFSSSAEAGAIYLQCLIEDYDGNQTFVLSVVNARSFTVDKKKHKRYILTSQCGTALQEVNVSSFKVQLEKGSTATSYTPYIEVEKITVKRCAKNLLTMPYYHGESRETNGITFTVNNDGSITAVGTATAAAWFTLSDVPFADVIPDFWTKVARQDCSYNSENGITSIFINSGDTVNKTYFPMMEIGTSVTDFEKGIELVNYIPDSDGNIIVESLSPILSLYTDTVGVMLECVYNKDINTVLQALNDKIVELEKLKGV